ncbi:LacI family DNA-binding transcriptional regulator [Brachybacterium sp. DNPG3]
MSSESSTAPRRPTLADVARAAGVSAGTASKALNGRGEVAAATREKVRAAADALGFTPNLQARSLMSGRTGIVGVLTDDLEGRFAMPVLIGAEQALAEVGTMAILADSHGDDALQRRHLASLLRHRVDGIIVVGSIPEPRTPLPVPAHVPVVYAYSPSTDPADISLLADHRGAGRLAAEHLLALGRTRVGMLAGPLDPGAGGHTASSARALGVVDALEAAGLRPVGGAPRFGAWTEDWGFAGAADLLGEADGGAADGGALDALVCASDTVARGAIDLLRSRGRRVPEDVAVIGFDDWTPVVEGRLPQSSVDLGLQEMGRLAARAVLAAVPGDGASGSDETDGAGPRIGPGRHLVAGTVVARRSTLG